LEAMRNGISNKQREERAAKRRNTQLVQSHSISIEGAAKQIQGKIELQVIFSDIVEFSDLALATLDEVKSLLRQYSSIEEGRTDIASMAHDKLEDLIRRITLIVFLGFGMVPRSENWATANLIFTEDFEEMLSNAST